MEQVGVRDLRQNLSVYLDRVKAGETLEVTEHKQPVAILSPLPSNPMGVRDRLIAEGLLIPGKGNLGEFMKNHPPLEPPPGWKPLSESIIEAREEERY